MNSDKAVDILWAYVKIIRPVNLVITFLSLILAGLLCGGSLIDAAVYYAAAAAALTAAGGNIINDVFDVKIDKINRPERPIPAGKISKSAALNYYLIINLGALSLAAMINITALVIVLVSITLIFFYCYYFKKIILFGNFIVSFLTGLAFIFGGVAVGSVEAGIIPGIFAFLANMIREIIKDIQDIEGDKKNNIITLPQKYGVDKAKAVAAFFTFTIILFTFVPFLFNLYNIEFFVLVMISANPGYIYVLKLLSKAETVKEYGKISSILKLNMVFGLISIYAGII